MLVACVHHRTASVKCEVAGGIGPHVGDPQPGRGQLGTDALEAELGTDLGPQLLTGLELQHQPEPRYVNGVAST